MVEKLTFIDDRSKWYPNSISQIECYLSVLITQNTYLDSSKCTGIRKNISYNLQYIEFLDRVIKDINLSEVLITQNFKTFLIIGSSIIESIFYFLVVSNGYGKTTDLVEVENYESKEYEISSKKYKNKTIIFHKVDTPISVVMTFDQMCKKVESRKLLGVSFGLYSKINPLRQLRNKIHIHDSSNSTDTDWYNFNRKEYNLIREVLYGVLTSDVFKNSNSKNIFDFLND